jgi:transcriptional regulator of acetoin/glycerol metabolism
VKLFNDEFARLYGQPPLDLEPAALEVLRAHDWPGNIRQLRTVMERLHVLCPDECITAAHVREIGLGVAAPAGVRSLDDVRADEVERVLRQNGGSVARTAASFGVHRSTIYRWLQARQPAARGRDRG